MIKKQKEPIEFITKKETTFLLVFKNNRPVPKLIKQDYLKAYYVDGNKRKMLNKDEVFKLPKKESSLSYSRK